MHAGGSVLGVDVGTTSTKAGVYDLQGAELAVATAVTVLHREPDGSVWQDPRELLSAAQSAIGEALGRAGVSGASILAAGISGQMAGVMGIDAAGEAAIPYDSWLDTRCASQLRALADGHGAEVLMRTGCPPMVDHAPKMQWWRDERPRDYARVARFVMPAAYVAGRLAGLAAADAFIDPTYLHFTGVADGRTATWSSELVAALNLDAAKLPRIVASDAIIGHVTTAMAEDCGLAAGTPLVAGMGDTAAGALGAGLTRPGDLLDTAGTAAVLSSPLPRFAADPEGALIVMRTGPGDRWAALNYIAGGGLCLPWLAAQLLPDPVWPGQARAGAIPELLNAAAAVGPGADGLRFMPHLEGRTAPYEPHLRGGFVGLAPGHGHGHLARAVLESIALEYRLYLEAMRRLDPRAGTGEVLAIGGGSRSGLWNAIKAEVLGIPLRRVELEETATRGVALLAGGAVGVLDAEAVAADVALGPCVEPDPGRHARYHETLEAHRRVLAAFSELSASELRPHAAVVA